MASADADCYRAQPPLCEHSWDPLHCGWIQRESEHGQQAYYYDCAASDGHNCETLADKEICRIVYLCRWISDEATGYGACFRRDPPNNIFLEHKKYPYYAITGDPCPQ